MHRSHNLTRGTGDVDAAIVRALLHHAKRLASPERAIVLQQVTEHQAHARVRPEPGDETTSSTSSARRS